MQPQQNLKKPDFLKEQKQRKKKGAKRERQNRFTVHPQRDS